MLRRLRKRKEKRSSSRVSNASTVIDPEGPVVDKRFTKAPCSGCIEENGGQALSGRSSSLSSNEVEKEMETATSGTFDTVTSAEFVSAGSETSTVVRSGSITSTCQVTLNWEAQEIDSESGEQYDMAYEEGDDDVADLGEHKSVIMSLLGQLKLGMDLTKVVLPTFILERKSLLETFANCFSHPDIFMSISDGRSPEERILRATKWLLTSFHAGRKGSIAKKPYNPIIGEIFNCAWNVDTRNGARPQCIAPNQVGDVTFLAEQVSHHPPISAFYAECKDKKICANYSVWTKSKFLGISVGVDMVGVGTISLLEHGEQYHFTLPSTYGRSILTVPWSEMGGKVQINCPQTDYTSTLIFHTKPMYGGKMHRVNGDIKDNMTGKMLYKLDGEWNGKMKFTDECEGISELVDTEILSVIKKDITPISKQKENESRRLWKDVTIALKKNDIEEATAAKFKLEQRQREEGAYRAANNIEWAPTHFKPDGDNWLYKKSIAGEREP